MLFLSSIDPADASNSVLQQMNILGSVIIPLASAALGGIIGGLVAFWQMKSNLVKEQAMSASILYYDLLSIQTYFSYGGISVPIRYSPNWQEMVARCPFLESAQVCLLYCIYDEVFNFNSQFAVKLERNLQHGGQPPARGKLTAYQNLKTYINKKDYEELLHALKRRTEKKGLSLT